jgi:signal peptidase II
MLLTGASRRCRAAKQVGRGLPCKPGLSVNLPRGDRRLDAVDITSIGTAACWQSSRAETHSSQGPPEDLVLRPNPKSTVLASFIIAGVVGLDQCSKQWALSALAKVGSTLLLPGPVDLTLVLNYSNAFGLVPVSGALTRWGLTALNLAVVCILLRVLVQQTTTRLSTVGLSFIIAGAIGNAVDRIRFGAVIDLFDASKLGFIWIFNAADVSIDIGIALLLVTALRTRTASTA